MLSHQCKYQNVNCAYLAIWNYSFSFIQLLHSSPHPPFFLLFSLFKINYDLCFFPLHAGSTEGAGSLETHGSPHARVFYDEELPGAHGRPALVCHGQRDLQYQQSAGWHGCRSLWDGEGSERVPGVRVCGERERKDSLWWIIIILIILDFFFSVNMDIFYWRFFICWELRSA